MAPNQKQLNLIVQQLSAGDLVGPSKTQVPARQSLTQSEADNYWSWAQEDTSEKTEEAYWDWSENPSLNVLSVDRVVQNLKSTHFVEQDDIIRSGLDTNDYWDETSTKDKEAKIISSNDQHTADSYWQWPSVKEEETTVVRNAIIDEILESEKVRQLLSIDNIMKNIQQEISDAYWRENEEVVTVHNSDDYWCEEISAI
mmetsp:Transcript_6292/g.9678  ORF Transcript_6292/g.9678 Transcript_6292/m.9678 type:complete len:199 (-) Transcript_6292:107-703(-)